MKFEGFNSFLSFLTTGEEVKNVPAGFIKNISKLVECFESGVFDYTPKDSEYLEHCKTQYLTHAKKESSEVKSYPVVGMHMKHTKVQCNGKDENILVFLTTNFDDIWAINAILTGPESLRHKSGRRNVQTQIYFDPTLFVCIYENESEEPKGEK